MVSLQSDHIFLLGLALIGLVLIAGGGGMIFDTDGKTYDHYAFETEDRYSYGTVEKHDYGNLSSATQDAFLGALEAERDDPYTVQSGSPPVEEFEYGTDNPELGQGVYLVRYQESLYRFHLRAPRGSTGGFLIPALGAVMTGLVALAVAVRWGRRTSAD